MRDQIWVKGQIWHPNRKRKPWTIDILLDTGAGGGSFISLALWIGLRRKFPKLRLNTLDAGYLAAANPSDLDVAPMAIKGSVKIPVVLTGDATVRTIRVRVVVGLPYAFIVGASYFRTNRSVLNFGEGKGLQPIPGAPWVPFDDPVPGFIPEPVANSPLCAARDHFALLNTTAVAQEEKPPPTPPIPSYHDIAWEDDGSLEWRVKLVSDRVTVEGFTSRAVEAAAIGTMPQDRQLVLVLPTERYDLAKGAVAGFARAVCWWQPGHPVYCKLVNRGRAKVAIEGRVIAKMIALNVRDPARFHSLFDASPSAVDPPLPPPPTEPTPSADTKPPRIDPASANTGSLGVSQKLQLHTLLNEFIDQDLFALDPKRVLVCIGGELELPLKDEACAPFAAKQRRFPPQESRLILAEIQLLVDRGIVEPAVSAWAAQCLAVKKKDGSIRLCVDWRMLNTHLVSDSGGLGDMQDIYDGLKGKRFYSQIDMASGFHQMSLAKKDRHKTAFRCPRGQLYQFTRAGFGLTVLPAAFTRRVKSALGYLDGVFSWLDDILIASDTWDEHVAMLIVVFHRLLKAGLSLNFAKCIFGAQAQEFLGMIIDCNGVHPSPAKMEAIANMPCPRSVEELRTFLGMTGYLCQHVPNYSLVAAPLTDILRNKEFASKRARKLPIPWGPAAQQAFDSLRTTLASPTVLAFPDLERPFELHTDASTIGAGAVLMQTIDGRSRVTSFASHRFSRTDVRRSPTERECMGILWGVDHFKPYLSGRPFTLVTDCSALTWLFRSRELCPKLHRWALRLTEYDMTLRWREGCQHVLPDALSRLPHSRMPQADVDDSFPDDLSSRDRADFVGPRGPILDGTRLSELEPLQPVVELALPRPASADGSAAVPPVEAQADGVGIAPRSPSVASPRPASADGTAIVPPVEAAADGVGVAPCSSVATPTPDPLNAALRELPFASCESLSALAPAPRRSNRDRTPSVRLRPPGDIPLSPEQLAEAHRPRVCTPSVIETSLAPPPPDVLLPSEAGDDDIGSVLSAGGRGVVPSPSPGSDQSAAARAVSTLANRPSLAKLQSEDVLLGQVRTVLKRGEGHNEIDASTKGYSLDENDVLRFEYEVGKRRVAIPAKMVADVLALVHTSHGHVGVGATLPL